MPRLEVIQNRISSLTPHQWFDEMFSKSDNQIWSGRQYGARFSVSRPVGEMIIINEPFDSIYLEISGRLLGRQRIVRDFVLALGMPNELYIDPRKKRSPFVAKWDSFSLVTTAFQSSTRAG